MTAGMQSLKYYEICCMGNIVGSLYLTYFHKHHREAELRDRNLSGLLKGLKGMKAWKNIQRMQT